VAVVLELSLVSFLLLLLDPLLPVPVQEGLVRMRVALCVLLLPVRMGVVVVVVVVVVVLAPLALGPTAAAAVVVVVVAVPLPEMVVAQWLCVGAVAAPSSSSSSSSLVLTLVSTLVSPSSPVSMLPFPGLPWWESGQRKWIAAAAQEQPFVPWLWKHPAVNVVLLVLLLLLLLPAGGGGGGECDGDTCRGTASGDAERLPLPWEPPKDS